MLTTCGSRYINGGRFVCPRYEEEDDNADDDDDDIDE